MANAQTTRTASLPTECLHHADILMLFFSTFSFTYCCSLLIEMQNAKNEELFLLFNYINGLSCTQEGSLWSSEGTGTNSGLNEVSSASTSLI